MGAVRKHRIMKSFINIILFSSVCCILPDNIYKRNIELDAGRQDAHGDWLGLPELTALEEMMFPTIKLLYGEESDSPEITIINEDPHEHFHDHAAEEEELCTTRRKRFYHHYLRCKGDRLIMPSVL